MPYQENGSILCHDYCPLSLYPLWKNESFSQKEKKKTNEMKRRYITRNAPATRTLSAYISRIECTQCVNVKYLPHTVQDSSTNTNA